MPSNAGGVPSFRSLGLALAPFLAVLLAFGYLRAAHAGEALPGTRVDGIDVAGQDEDAVRERLQARAGRTLVLGGRDGQAVRLRLPEAGVVLDVAATTRRAMDAGRDGVVGGLVSTLAGVVRDHDVDPVVRIDDRKLDRAVGRVAARLGRRASDGALRVEPTTLEVSTDEPQAGRSVRRGELTGLLRAAARNDRRRITVPLRTLKAASPEALSDVAARAEEFLATPVTVRAADRTRTLTGAQLAPLLRLDGEGDDVRLGADPAVARTLVGTVASAVDRPARPPRFSVAGASGVVVDGKGDVAWRPRKAKVTASGGRSGRAVQADAAAKALAAAIRAGRHEVRFPTKTVRPAITRKNAAQVDALIGTFTTRYEPGQPRVKNIQRIARSVDGTVVAPGAPFSLNGVAGQRTAEKGYVEAPYIADGKIKPSIGGGVSQFSTTVYNAAYFAGLPIGAATAHSLFIDRYPPGRETTLNFPDIDLTWTNDTGAPIVVRASYDATSVTVRLFGKDTGRRVRATTGAREDVADKDFAITVTRTIRYDDGRVVRQPRTTTYDLPLE